MNGEGMTKRMKGMAVGLMCVAMACAAQAQQGSGLAFQRAQHLQRGLNLSSFYAQTKDNPVFEQRMFFNDGDFGIGASWATPIVGRSGMSASLFVAVVSKFFPVVGMFAAAFVFPDGIHSGHGMA
jgi:hypothetical protein